MLRPGRLARAAYARSFLDKSAGIPGTAGGCRSVGEVTREDPHGILRRPAAMTPCPARVPAFSGIVEDLSRSTSRKPATAADSWISILVQAAYEDLGISLVVRDDDVPGGSLAVLGPAHDRQDGAPYSGRNAGRLDDVHGVLSG